MAEIVRVGWGAGTPAFRRMFAELMMPQANEEQVEWFGELQRRTTTPETAARIMEASGDIDVADRLTLVSAPTLVLHPRARCHGALRSGPHRSRRAFRTRTSSSSIAPTTCSLDNEPAWERFKEVVGEFLGWQREAPRRRAADAPPAVEDLATLTTREREILDLVAGGANNHDIAEQALHQRKDRAQPPHRDLRQARREFALAGHRVRARSGLAGRPH